MHKPSRFMSCFLPALLVVFFTTSIGAQVRPKPTPSSDDLLTPDPAVGPKGEIRPRPKYEAAPAYYIRLSGVSRVLVSDAKGKTDDLFRAGSIQQVEATYDFLGPNTVFITLPVSETYSITFETKDPAINLEIVKGIGNASPDEAIRYNDLVIDNGTARFRLSAAGVMPLQLDANHDGRFESILEPSAHVRGDAAKDTRGPVIRFEVLERDATSVLVAIKATDNATGVKNLFYSLDEKHEFPYEGPVRVKLSEAKLIMAIADDNAGNRSVYYYRFERIR